MTRVSVLIVDDSEADRYILKRQLEKTGLVKGVIEAGDGKDALDLFREYDVKRDEYPEDFPPLAIFLDINMPLIDGFQFLEEFGPLRDEYDIDSTFIMMFSTSASEADRRKAFAYSYVKGYLTKGSYSTDQLREEINKLRNK